MQAALPVLFYKYLLSLPQVDDSLGRGRGREHKVPLILEELRGSKEGGGKAAGPAGGQSEIVVWVHQAQ